MTGVQTCALPISEGNALTGVSIYGNTAFKDGLATINLKAGESITFTNVPTGYHYSVSERDISGYTPVFLGNPGVIEKDTTNVITCDNVKKTVDLPETNTVFLSKTCSSTDSFTFYVALTGLENNKTYSYIYTSNSATFSYTSSSTGTADLVVSLTGGDSIEFTELPVGSTYKITETPNAYIPSYSVFDALDMGLISSYKGANTESSSSLSTMKETVDSGEEIYVNFVNTEEKFDVDIAKMDDDGGMVEGAVLQVLSAGGNVLYEWTTEAGSVKTLSLPVGTYTLHEKTTPLGYETALDISFIVSISDGEASLTLEGSDEKLVRVEMIDKKATAEVSFDKQKTDGISLNGAVLQVLDYEGKVLDEWTTDGTVHKTSLSSNTTYTLHEKSAPDGYAYATDIVFSTDAEGKVSIDATGENVDVVVMVDKELSVLPNLGLTDIRWLMIVPFLGLFACSFILVKNKRRKKGNFNSRNKD